VIIVQRGIALTKDNPGPIFYGILRGWLTDVATLTFQVWSTGATPAQIYPVSGVATVDLEDDRIGKGRYAAPWSVGSGLNEGAYEVRWFYRWTLSGAELTARERIEVVASLPVDGPFYAAPSELTAEGVSDYASVRMLTALARAGEQLDTFTRTWFEPRYREVHFDAQGGALLHLPHAILGIESVLVDDNEVPSEDVVVYTREEDRKNPKIARKNGCWPRRRSLIEVRGVFGTRKLTGPPWGVTHPLAAHVTRLIALRELPPIGDTDASATAKSGGKIQSESTRDQSVTYAPTAGQSGRANAPFWFTGDPEIDQLIMGLKGPLNIGVT
jgi:hypothetical protein